MTKYLSTVSRSLSPTDYAWDSVVHQFARPLLDSELNLSQDILSEKTRPDLPSGILTRYPIKENKAGFEFLKPTDGDFEPNVLRLKRFKALVAGKVLDVKSTSSTTTINKVTLPDPETTSGPGTNTKRTDFLFLEMWLQEVTPSMNARARLRAVGVLAGDTLTIGDGVNPDVVLTADTDFSVGASNPHTARNLAEAINNYDGLNLGLTLGSVTITAETRGTDFLFLLMTGGADGNNITFTPSSLSSIEVTNTSSGGTTGTGKPDANHVYYAGNVLSDSSLWLEDDIQDPNIATSTTRRVQVQYRIRVYSSTFFNPVTTPFGLDDGSIYAQGGAGSVVSPYIFSRHDTDYGLWIAGSGDLTSATDLNTVDGFVYAIPLCFVFRRNQADVGNGYGFNPYDDVNTGLLSTHDGTFTNAVICADPIPVGESDRPDGLFADEISEADVLDLRRRVFPQGVDYSSALEYQFHSLLDNTNRTWFLDESVFNTYGDSTGGISTTPMVCDVFGLEDLSSGNYKRDFDRIARRFSTAPLIERTTIVAYPEGFLSPVRGVVVNSAGGDPTKWFEGDEIFINFDELNARSNALWNTFEVGDPETDNPSDYWISGTKVLDVGLCWHDDTDGSSTSTTNNRAKFSKIEILSATQVKLTLGRNAQLANRGDGVTPPSPTECLVGDATGNTGSAYGLFIEVILEYPATDKGLTETPIGSLEPSVTAYPTGAVLNLPVGTMPHDDAENEKPLVYLADQRREVSIEYIGQAITTELVSISGTAVRLPYRVYYDGITPPTVEDISGGAEDGTFKTLILSECKFGQAETILVWVADTITTPRLVSVTAYPLLPCVPTKVSYYIYYRAVCPQTCGTKVGSVSGYCPDELELQPLSISRNITTLLQGAGASTSGYPFYAPYEQLGTSSLAEVTYGYTEWGVLNGTEVYLDDLRINTGMVDLPSFVPFVSSVNITLGEITGGGVPTKDNEGRVVYPTLENASYFPSAFAKNLGAFYRDYKTCLPALMKITSDEHTLYRRGEVVLVVFVKTTPWGQGVAVDMREDETNLVVACVYRTRHLMLLGD